MIAQGHPTRAFRLNKKQPLPPPRNPLDPVPSLQWKESWGSVQLWRKLNGKGLQSALAEI